MRNNNKESNYNQEKPLIILCVDTSNLTNTIFRYACYEAKKLNFTLQILTIIESSHKNLIFGSRAIGNQKRQEIEKTLQNLNEQVFQETGIMPVISIREGDVLSEIIAEIRDNKNCAMLLLSKSCNTMSDNSLLPKLVNQIGNKINVPITIIPENFEEKLLLR